ncbi:ABC transporter substrate-binding protein [Enterovirga sp. CN4-39]|uniref:ABC transporter substrate-binding protein n=1 Tax=Enterovirga sp. CN4-39 TaxID=3400910 RepID=UPI003C0B489A
MRPEDPQRLDVLLDRYRDGQIDRRTFLSLLGFAGLAAGVVGGPLRAMAQAGGDAVKQIRFDSWGGVVSEAIRRTAITPYEKTTGIKVVEGTFGLEEEILSKAKAGRPGDYNVISSAGLSWYKRWIDAGFGVTLNEGNIPNIKNVIPALLEPFRKITPDGLSAVPYTYGNTGIAYNSNFISHDEAKAKRENLLLDPKYKGKLSGHNDFQTRMWIAAAQTRQDGNDIKDLDKVWAAIRENRGLVKKYWSSGAESMELLASGEVYAADIWSGRAAALIERSPHIGYVDFNKAYCWGGDMLVLKGSPVGACERFLNFLLEPEVGIAIGEAQLYPTPFDPNKVPMPEKIKRLPNYDPTGTLERYVFADPNYWTKYEKDWKPMYSRIEKGF